MTLEDAVRLLETFVPVVRMYLDAFDPEELMSGTERLMLQNVEDALAEHDALLVIDGDADA